MGALPDATCVRERVSCRYTGHLGQMATRRGQAGGAQSSIEGPEERVKHKGKNEDPGDTLGPWHRAALDCMAALMEAPGLPLFWGIIMCF